MDGDTMAKTRTKQIRMVVSDDEYAMFKKMAEDNNTSMAQIIRSLIGQVRNKEINDTAKAIQSVEKMLEDKLMKFADAQDTATAFIINNMSVFYETKLSQVQAKVDEMAPYYEEARRIFAANEARKRKTRAQKRQMAN